MVKVCGQNDKLIDINDIYKKKKKLTKSLKRVFVRSKLSTQRNVHEHIRVGHYCVGFSV